MRIDYHMHFEYGSYNEDWVKGFFEAAQKRGIDEIGISEHSHGFSEFKDLYYEDLILDDSFVGKFQKKWLKKNKFKNTIDEYVDFINHLKEKGYPVKLGLEVCNFKDQEKVKEILSKYDFDYIIGSIHFIDGWAYDSSAIKKEWEKRDIMKVYQKYVDEIKKMASSGLYDILGHPFNLRLYNYIPKDDIRGLINQAIDSLVKNDMAIDINTGTYYRYPIKEISPYPEFMKIASKKKVPIITSSDAHRPEDAGKYNDMAIEYAKKYGYKKIATYKDRKRILKDIT
ncbi:MAG: histidinol-phosphatase [Fusobacteriota bacterium]